MSFFARHGIIERMGNRKLLDKSEVVKESELDTMIHDTMEEYKNVER